MNRRANSSLYGDYRRVRAGGFTLTELMIYIMMSVLVLGAILVSFYYSSRAFRKTSASYDINKEVPIAVEWIRKDLLSSSLTSIRVYPNRTNSSESPGISFISAMTPDSDIVPGGEAQLELTSFGTPRWSKHVFYFVVPHSRQPSADYLPRMGSLKRFEIKMSNPPVFPMPTDLLPSNALGQSASQRTIIKNILMPDTRSMAGIEPYKLDDRNHGGFRVAFVRKDPLSGGGIVLTDMNPSQVRDTGGGGSSPTSLTTDLVQVDLTALQISHSTGRPSTYSMGFQVRPRN